MAKLEVGVDVSGEVNAELMDHYQKVVEDNIHLRRTINECMEIIEKQGVLIGKLQLLND